MDLLTYRYKIGRFIIFSTILLFILILALTITGGFIPSECTELFSYLIPIKAMYLTAVVKFVLAQRHQPNRAQAEASPFYRLTTRIFIYSHITLLYLLILLCAFNVIDFKFLLYGIGILESFCGIYIGLIVTDLFPATKKG